MATAGAAQCDEDIAWSSSDSQQSEDEDQRRAQRPRTLAAAIQPSRASRSRTYETGKWNYERERS